MKLPKKSPKKNLNQKQIKIRFWVFLSIGLILFAPSAVASMWNEIGQYNYQKTVNRSIWFLHPAEDRPAMVIIQDEYLARKPSENISLVVHGLGNMILTESGAVWDVDGINGVQVEICTPVSHLEEKYGYNAETKQFEPYLIATLAEKEDTKCVWVCLATQNNNTLPINIQSNQITINNTVRLTIPDNPTHEMEIESWDMPGESHYFYGDMLLEVNGSAPFTAGANVIDILNLPEIPEDSGTISGETYEEGNSHKIMSEDYTIEQDTAESRNIIQMPTLDSLGSSLALLPDETPFLLVDNSMKSSIYNKLANATYFLLNSSLENSTTAAMQYNLSDESISALINRPLVAYRLAIRAWLSNNQTEAEFVYRLMDRMDQHEQRVEEDPKMLGHGLYLLRYTQTWDLIEHMLNNSQNSLIRNNLQNYAEFVDGTLDKVGNNNWELVVGSGVGMAGIKLRDAHLVHHTLEKVEHYLSENVRLEGALYEGQGYCGYAFSYIKNFLIALQRYSGLGFPNLLSDARFQSVFRFLARSSPPDGYYPLFEDSASYSSAVSNGVILAPFFAATGNTALASELMWYREVADNPSSHWEERLFYSNLSIPARKPVIPGRFDDPDIYSGFSYVAPDSGLAIFRNNWSRNAAYLAATAKNYPQSHSHKDELCFEFYANGVKLLTMPGYPGWGKEHHTWTTTTEASNGGIIFGGNGQTGTKCTTGIVEWLRGNQTDYVKMEGDGLYYFDFYGSFESKWIVYAIMGVGSIIVVVSFLRKKQAVLSSR